MKSKILNIYSMRAKFKFDAKVLCVELVIMNHETNEITEFRIPLAFDEKVEKVSSKPEQVEQKDEEPKVPGDLND